jgi:hypothetical protein
MQRLVTLIVVLIGLGLAGTGIYLIILGPEATLSQVTVAPVTPGDQEIAWLHPATNATTWERFVAGLKEIPDIQLDESSAFPEDSMKPPAVSLQKKDYPGKLWIRWYKLTGLKTTEIWVNDLCRRDLPPLAIVGGGNSERARELASQLANTRRRAVRELETRRSTAPVTITPPRLPVLLITTATADQVQHAELGKIDLMYIYTDRSFRFCFTNRQMAEAICDFARVQLSQDQNLQVTSSEISLLSWADDPYSGDLAQQFGENWQIPTDLTPNPRVWSQRIPHSVGSLNQPNRLEAEALDQLLKNAGGEAATGRGRELLVVPGAVAPVRRLLRGLVRTDLNERFFWIVTAGDAIDWNTIYRDRRLAWPIADVPFPLILFMHRNPVERQLSHGQGFVPEGLPGALASPTGTDDLLLYRDIGLALVRACFQETRVFDTQDRTSFRLVKKVLDDPDQLIFRLRQEQDEQGFSIFDALGNRSGRGGEYVTLLRPLYDGLRLLPQSRIDVYNRDPATQQWKKVQTLDADYGTSDSSAATQGRTP